MLLVPALFMAQVFWGTELGFGVFSLIRPHNGSVAIGVMSLCGALAAAVPFGLLFGLAAPHHSKWVSAGFALAPALILFVFSAWFDQAALVSLWLARVSDVVLFTGLFVGFAAAWLHDPTTDKVAVAED